MIRRPLWLARPSRFAAATFTAYALAISIFARFDIFYWGLMIAPVFLSRSGLAPDGLRDFARSALDRWRVRVQRVER